MSHSDNVTVEATRNSYSLLKTSGQMEGRMDGGKDGWREGWIDAIKWICIRIDR